MGRKSLYRSFSFTDQDKVRRLQSSLPGLPAHNSGKYQTTLTGGSVCDLETNLPLSELRAWFRAADVPMRDHVTDSVSLEERVKEWN